MSAPLLRCGLSAALLLAFLSVAPAQAPKPPPVAPPKAAEARPDEGESNDYRRFFKSPRNVKEYWDAFQFEIEVGRYDLAALHLHGLMALKPTDKDLVSLHRELGLAAFLRLRNVTKWSDKPKEQEQARKDVEELIKRVTDAVRKELGDRKRIEMFIKNLSATPEEASFALKELYRSGAVVIPYMIDELQGAKPEVRLEILRALRRLGPETLPPLIAALDSDDAQLKVDLIDLFLKRAATQVVPYLWYLSASASQPEEVRRKATGALAYFLDTKASILPPAKGELTRQAELYYQHKVAFADPKAVVVWRWHDRHVMEGWTGAPTVPATRAEEYYGLRFAGQALSLDPTYRPAQVVLLNLVLEKGMERGGLIQPLAKTVPAVHDLMATVNAELVIAVLERALREDRVPLILGAVRDLGGRKEVRAIRPTKTGAPPLVQALYYPDRRVQRAAADALLRIPGKPTTPVGGRIVDVLRRELGALPNPGARHKVLIGFPNEDYANRVADAVTRAGYDPVKAATGKALLRRLKEASDIDLLLIDANLPLPMLPYLLAQLSADRYAGRLPVLVTASADREEKLRRFAQRYPSVTVVGTGLATDVPRLRGAIQARIADPGSPALTEAERTAYAETAILLLAGLARGSPPGYDVRPAAPTILDALRADKLSPEGQIAAVEATSWLPDNEAQRELYRVIKNSKRLEVRLAATTGLIRHIQMHSLLLTPAEVKTLVDLFKQKDIDPRLKANLASVMGSLHPDARLTGERLLDFQPPTPGKAPPPKPDK